MGDQGEAALFDRWPMPTQHHFTVHDQRTVTPRYERDNRSQQEWHYQNKVRRTFPTDTEGGDRQPLIANYTQRFSYLTDQAKNLYLTNQGTIYATVADG
jgi:hypothetical protein